MKNERDTICLIEGLSIGRIAVLILIERDDDGILLPEKREAVCKPVVRCRVSDALQAQNLSETCFLYRHPSRTLNRQWPLEIQTKADPSADGRADEIGGNREDKALGPQMPCHRRDCEGSSPYNRSQIS